MCAILSKYSVKPEIATYHCEKQKIEQIKDSPFVMEFVQYACD